LARKVASVSKSTDSYKTSGERERIKQRLKDKSLDER